MEIDETVSALAALAQPTRLDAFRILVRHEPVGLAAGDLARTLEVPPNTLSAHLSILSRAGLVSSERRSRSIIYRASLDKLQDLVLYMVQDCCGGRPEVCTPLIESLTPRYVPTKKQRIRA